MSAYLTLLQLRVTMDDFALAQAAFTPLSLRGVTLQKSEVQWSDIGGAKLHGMEHPLIWL